MRAARPLSGEPDELRTAANCALRTAAVALALPVPGDRRLADGAALAPRVAIAAAARF
jgi:hypothetical protein